jgi:hypothetical protein
LTSVRANAIYRAIMSSRFVLIAVLYACLGLCAQMHAQSPSPAEVKNLSPDSTFAVTSRENRYDGTKLNFVAILQRNVNNGNIIDLCPVC